MDVESALQDDTSPQQRLERTRHALAQQLARRRRQRGGQAAALAADSAAPADGLPARARRAARTWWYHHPVHDAVDFARPALEDYARKKPLQLVGIAAGTGAALTLLRAWRWLSLTGIALALLKTSDIKGVAKSLVAAPPSPHEPTP